MSSTHLPALFATTSLAQEILQSCGTFGNVVIDAIAREDWHAIAGASAPVVEMFSNPHEFAKAYLAYNLLRKFDSFPIKIDRSGRALDDFLFSEVRCGQVNREVDALPYVSGVLLECQLQSIVELAKGLISKALGKFDLVEFQASCDFSNGSSTRCKRTASHPIEKLSGIPHVTMNCRDLAVHYIWCNDLWRKTCQETHGRQSDPYSWVKVVPGSRFSTVPKDSLKDRPICVEPDLNMFFQKGIGSMIRRRLARRGIDLNDQTCNQRLAQIGSQTGELATIDLKSASDSISLRVVEMLIPESWYEYMLITRSPYTLLKTGYHKLEKISSMGNGFTFELESLLFWGLSKACAIVMGCKEQPLSVYGDDIIIGTRAASSLISVLEALGFETNISKTFVAGPFRESCGKHYFQGWDVSPFYMKAATDTWEEIYHTVNSFAEWVGSDQESVHALTALALKPIPPRSRCYVPSHFGSKAGIRTVDTSRFRWCSKRQSYKFHYLRRVRDDHTFNGPYAYLGSMLLSEQREQSEWSSSQKGRERVVRSCGYTSRW